jgi:hypothetical protein
MGPRGSDFSTATFSNGLLRFFKEHHESALRKKESTVLGTGILGSTSYFLEFTQLL